MKSMDVCRVGYNSKLVILLKGKHERAITIKDNCDVASQPVANDNSPLPSRKINLVHPIENWAEVY